jgi:hypothetical protein
LEGGFVNAIAQPWMGEWVDRMMPLVESASPSSITLSPSEGLLTWPLSAETLSSSSGKTDSCPAYQSATRWIRLALSADAIGWGSTWGAVKIPDRSPSSAHSGSSCARLWIPSVAGPQSASVGLARGTGMA